MILCLLFSIWAGLHMPHLQLWSCAAAHKSSMELLGSWLAGNVHCSVLTHMAQALLWTAEKGNLGWVHVVPWVGESSPDRRQGRQSHQFVPSPQALLPCSSSLFLLHLPSLPAKTCLSKGEVGDVLENVKTFLCSFSSSAKVMFILCSCQRGSASQRPLLP